MDGRWIRDQILVNGMLKKLLKERLRIDHTTEEDMETIGPVRAPRLSCAADARRAARCLMAHSRRQIRSVSARNPG